MRRVSRSSGEESNSTRRSASQQAAGNAETKIKPYNAALDYGTRSSERNKQIIPFGNRKATIYRRGDLENSSWFYRIYIREEKRHYRKSLKTTDRREAIQFAQDELVSILAKIRTGERILAISLQDLCRRYAMHQEQLVRDGTIAPKTLALNRFRLKLGCEFLKEKLPAGMETKVSALDGNLFEQYLPWRQAKAARKREGGTIRRDVVRDELLSIRKMFHYARRERLCTDRSVPSWNFTVEKEGPKRRRITIKEFSAVIDCLLAWIEDAAEHSDREQYRRLLLMSIVRVVSYTGMRSGEVFGLKNSDVEMRESKAECVITIRAKTSKVRRERRVTIYGVRVSRQKVNPLIDWLLDWQRHKAPDDYVFSPYESGATPGRDYYYHAYKLFRKQLKKIGLEWFDTYHFRHHWITTRLLAGESIHSIANAAGTSVAEIESTYSHVLTEMITSKFSEREVRWKPDWSFDVVEKLKRRK